MRASVSLIPRIIFRLSSISTPGSASEIRSLMSAMTQGGHSTQRPKGSSASTVGALCLALRSLFRAACTQRRFFGGLPLQPGSGRPKRRRSCVRNDGRCETGRGRPYSFLRGLGLEAAFFRYRFVCFFDSGKLRFRNRYELRRHTTRKEVVRLAFGNEPMVRAG